jgi:hypothetical protein
MAVPTVLVDTYAYNDVIVWAALRGERCAKCGKRWFTSGEWGSSEIAAAKLIMGLGSRDPKAFTFCRNALGLGTPTMAERFGTTAEAVAIYKAQGIVEPEWWTTLEHLVAIARPEDHEVPLPPLPPCSGCRLSK